MDNILQQLRDLASDLSTKLATASMDDLVQFTEQRTQLIEQLQTKVKQLSEQEYKQWAPIYAQRVQEIGHYDQLILDKMNELKDEAAAGLAKIKQSRLQKSAYDTVYTRESAFIDKKK